MLQRQHKTIGASFARLAADLQCRAPDGDAARLVQHPLPELLESRTRARAPSLSIIALTLVWRSHGWWEWQQALMTTVDAANTLGWRHHRPGRHMSLETSLVKTFGSDWMQMAIGQKWTDSLAKFTDAAHAQISVRSHEARYAAKPDGKAAQSLQRPNKAPRLVTWEPQQWADTGSRLEVCGDSRVIIQWVNAVWPVRSLPYARCIQRMHRMMHGMRRECGVRPRVDSVDFCRHIYRELNVEADRIANMHSNSWSLVHYDAPATRVRAFFDGSKRSQQTAFGWIVYCCDGAERDETSEWKPVATRSVVLPKEATITAAELEACSSVVSFLRAYFLGYTQALAEIQTQRLLDYNAVRILSLASMV